MKLLVGVFAYTLGCAILFGVLQWLFPSNEHQPTLPKRRGIKTDTWYWIVLPIIDRLVFKMIVIAAIVGFFMFEAMGKLPSSFWE